MSVCRNVCKRVLSLAGGGGLAVLVAGCDYFSPEGGIRDQLVQSVSAVYSFYSTAQDATTAMDSAKDGDILYSTSFRIDTRHSFSEIPDPQNPDDNDWQFLGWKFHSSYNGTYTGEWYGETDDVAGFSNFTLDESGYVQEVTVSPMYARFYAEFGVEYVVQYQLQNTDLATYATVDGDTKTLKGVPGTQAKVPQKEYEGFRQSEFPYVTIRAPEEGQTVIRVKYDRLAYTLTLDANGGADSSGTITTMDYTLYYGVPTALDSPFVLEGHTFMGWATSADRAKSGTVDYADKADYAIGAADVTLYAVWQPNDVNWGITLPEAGGEMAVTVSPALAVTAGTTITITVTEGTTITVTYDVATYTGATYTVVDDDDAAALADKITLDAAAGTLTIGTAGLTHGTYMVRLTAQKGADTYSRLLAVTVQ